MTMTKEQYEKQKTQIETDPRYPEKMRIWMLGVLEGMWLRDQEVKSDES